ncbi:hypothetical protein DEO72_LG8g2580 [Vigna unguiculata]|uniref:Uncharacterized protein n=1 Tax=Vigna unguiculata TaxID=3917 RepID=A0A4D6MUX0_VIGUN|nr:hypothetical protein DEO72_LG8g2580 [Vigna unguiculata]
MVVDGGVWPRGILEPGRVRSREQRRDGCVVTSRGVLARQRHRDSLDGDSGTGDDLEVAEPADDGLRQASPCLAHVGEERRRRCVVTGVFLVVDDVVTGVVTDVPGAARQRWKWCVGGR